MSIKGEIRRPEMGARLGPEGLCFRVWAPHAGKVYVTGTFNEWGKTPALLVKDKEGYWSG